MKDHDNEIISLFVSRSEEAIVKLTERYGRLGLGIAENILSNHEDENVNPGSTVPGLTFSMIEVDGRWHQVYHRATGIGPTRQAMAEEINLRVEGEKLIIEQAEVTSQGFRTQGLCPYEKQYAVSACFGLGSYTFDVNPALDFNPDSVREDRYPVTNLKYHSWLGYKYFDFSEGVKEGEQLYLNLSLKDCAVGGINIYATEPKEPYSFPEQPRTLIGTAVLDGTDTCREIAVPVSSLSGRKAVYLEFCSDSDGTVCELDKLWFTAAEGTVALK